MDHLPHPLTHPLATGLELVSLANLGLEVPQLCQVAVALEQVLVALNLVEARSAAAVEEAAPALSSGVAALALLPYRDLEGSLLLPASQAAALHEPGVLAFGVREENQALPRLQQSDLQSLLDYWQPVP